MISNRRDTTESFILMQLMVVIQKTGCFLWAEIGVNLFAGGKLGLFDELERTKGCVIGEGFPLDGDFDFVNDADAATDIFEDELITCAVSDCDVKP